MIKKLDWYIIRKFLGTFILSIILIISIIIVLDLTEKVDKFYDKHAPLEAIIFDYYLNFIPFFFNMLSPLFVFIAVIFFTSKLAGNSEIIAIQSSGVSYNRILRPYLITATLIAITIFLLGSFVIPKSNKTRLEFENEYVKPFKKESVMNIQLEVDKGVILYIGHFESSRNTGYRVSMEKFNGKTLASRLTAQEIKYDTLTGRWQMNNFVMREFDGIHEKLQTGFNLDTAINIVPADFFVNIKEAPQMTTKELSEYIDRQRSRGVGAIKAFEDEYYKRFSMPFAAFILTIMGVALSSKKVRGGTGINMGLGLALSAIYVLFSTFTSSFSINGSMLPLLAVWLPNIAFSIIAFYCYWKAPK